VSPSPPKELRFSVHAASDVGRLREQNEDSLFAGDTVFAVADGMGGHLAGEVASDTALEPLRWLDGRRFVSAQEAQAALVDAIAAANERVIDKAEEDPAFRGMGTTLTAVLVRDSRIHVAHVGDSRAYLLRHGEEISQLTTDHTLVEQLVRDGRISRDEAATHPQRSVITRAVGVERGLQVDSLPPVELQPGDQVLLCSDGLTGPVDDRTIAEVLRRAPDGDSACRELVRLANEAGGPDNISVVLLRLDDGARRGAAGDGTATDSDDSPTVRISTRQETGADWATSMGRLGAPQGVSRRPAAKVPGGRGRRALATILAVAVLLAVVVGGGWFLLAQAFFVGIDDGGIAIFRGIPQDVGGVGLYWVEEGTDLDANDLAPVFRHRLEEGVAVGSLLEGRRLVSEYRRQIEEAEERSAPTPGGADDTPGADTEAP
jgi:PPM family protein phosphatase